MSDLAKASVDAVVQEIHAAGGTAIGVVCNVTDWDQQVSMFVSSSVFLEGTVGADHEAVQRAAITSFGPVDVCVVNAGIAEAPGWISGDVDSKGDPKVRLKIELVRTCSRRRNSVQASQSSTSTSPALPTPSISPSTTSTRTRVKVTRQLCCSDQCVSRGSACASRPMTDFFPSQRRSSRSQVPLCTL